MKQVVRSNYFCAFPVAWDCSCLQLSLNGVKGFLVNNRFMTVADMVSIQLRVAHLMQCCYYLHRMAEEKQGFGRVG